jgi:hypothetical protein
VFTDCEATREALRAARHLARDLKTRLVLLVAKVVPYPVPLEEPLVPGTFTADLLSQLAAEQQAEIAVRVYLCRDRDETIRGALVPGSLVVIGRQKRWWQNQTRVLVRQLRRDGHEVILAGTGRMQPAPMSSVNVESSL